MVALFLRPDADQSDGSWLNEAASNTNLFNSVDESSFSDTDFIKSSSTSGDKVRMRLSDPGATVTAPMTVRYRCKKDGTATANVIGRLFQGTSPGTQIATWTQMLTTTFTTYTYTLTSPEFSSISDFNDLYIEFEYNTDWWLASANIDLWFEQALYYDSGAGGTGQAVTSYLSCLRASPGYAKNADGTLTSFSSNVLRIGVGTGLLVEDARQNVCLQSQSFTGGNWGTDNYNTPTANATAAPDGTTTAAKIIPTSAASTFHTVYTSSAGIASGVASASCYFKAAEYGFGVLTIVENGGANRYAIIINLSTGAITDTHTQGTLTGTPTATVETLGSGWYRGSIALTAGGCDGLIVTAFNASTAGSWDGRGVPNWTPDGTSGIYVWGAQIEAAAFPSSYVPTTTGPVTRAADAVSVTSSLDTLLKASARTAVVSVLASGTPVTWDIISGSTAGNQLVVSSSDVIITSNTTTKSFSGSGTFTAGVKVGSGTNGTATSVTGAGLTVATGSSGVANTGTVYLGSDGTNYWYGYLRRASFFNSKIADATLQGFTAP